MKPPPSGIIAALPTPFARRSVDLSALARHATWLVREGCRCLAVGTGTGEAPTLTAAERRRLIRACVEAVGTRAWVLAGLSHNSTAGCVTAATEACDAGAHGLLVATPPYNKPGQEGLLRHVAAIAAATDLPIIVHNAPGRSAIDLKPETVLALVADGAIAGLVDDPARIATLAAATRGRLVLFGGSDAAALPANLAGAEGYLSILANVVPGPCSDVQAACARGDWARAATIQQRLQPLLQALQQEPEPAALKAALRHLCFPQGLRLPMVPASPAAEAAIAAALADLVTHVPEDPAGDPSRLHRLA